MIVEQRSLAEINGDLRSTAKGAKRWFAIGGLMMGAFGITQVADSKTDDNLNRALSTLKVAEAVATTGAMYKSYKKGDVYDVLWHQKNANSEYKAEVAAERVVDDAKMSTFSADAFRREQQFGPGFVSGLAHDSHRLKRYGKNIEKTVAHNLSPNVKDPLNKLLNDRQWGQLSADLDDDFGDEVSRQALQERVTLDTLDDLYTLDDGSSWPSWYSHVAPFLGSRNGSFRRVSLQDEQLPRYTPREGGVGRSVARVMNLSNMSEIMSREQPSPHSYVAALDLLAPMADQRSWVGFIQDTMKGQLYVPESHPLKVNLEPIAQQV